eukprot:Lithocolla_globosa_v1_NODE_30_length_9033_cov_22.154583.p3 type:complete len:310 gc:universal NODE_30_length_9033_cov_22.154583:4724-5653(+)
MEGYWNTSGCSSLQITSLTGSTIHNLKGYDSHLIISHLHNEFNKISCIPNNEERYISFRLDQFHFIDSLAFMNTSLEKLTENNIMGAIRKTVDPKIMKTLTHKMEKKKIKPSSQEYLKFFDHETKEKAIKGIREKMKITSERWEKDDDLILMLRKGVYPYEYVDSFKKFEQTEKPTKELFYSSLNNEHISDDDYNHFNKVWDKLKIKNLGEYHDLYLESDVLLLTDIFQNFREFVYREYGLDPAWYCTLPGFAWDAMLKMTGVKLELLTDPEMHLFIERAKRGGVSMISTKYAKANNPYCPDLKKKKIF